MNEVYIKNLLDEFRVNKKVIEKLREEFDIESILNVAFKEKMYDVILELFKPIEIDNEIKIYFDIFTYLSIIGGLPCFLNRFIVSESEKENIANSIYNFDMEKIKKIKIGDTLPREISGWAYPVNKVNDVIYYAEPACIEAMINLFNKNIRTTMNDTGCVYGEDTENGICKIWIDYGALSEENKNIANELINRNVAEFIDKQSQQTIEIRVPCKKSDTVEIVSERLKSITELFVMQPILYGFLTHEQMMKQIKEYVKNGIYNDFPLPDGTDTFSSYCIKLIESGEVKEKENGNIETEDGRTYLIDDFVDVIANSHKFIQDYIDFNGGYYYDEEENKYWQSEELYKRHIESLKDMSNENQTNNSRK